jgi:hypothetical protein
MDNWFYWELLSAEDVVSSWTKNHCEGVVVIIHNGRTSFCSGKRKFCCIFWVSMCVTVSVCICNHRFVYVCVCQIVSFFFFLVCILSVNCLCAQIFWVFCIRVYMLCTCVLVLLPSCLCVYLCVPWWFYVLVLTVLVHTVYTLYHCVCLVSDVKLVCECSSEHCQFLLPHTAIVQKWVFKNKCLAFHCFPPCKCSQSEMVNEIL